MILVFFSCRQQDLYRILKAYTIYRPDEGYCQAQAPVAAVLLMHMPAEVRGQWVTDIYWVYGKLKMGPALIQIITEERKLHKYLHNGPMLSCVTTNRAE